MKKLSILSFLFIFGCVGGSDGGQAAPDICDSVGTAGFEVGEVEVTVEKIPDPEGSVLPSEFTLRFKARVTDNKNFQAMGYADFEIHTFEDKDKSSKKIKCDNEDYSWECFKVTADAQGDIVWTERFSFPLRMEQKWIQFERVITNLDGKSIIPVMVNPWLENSDRKAYDMRKHDKNDYTEEVFNESEFLPEDISSAEKLKQCVEARSLEKSFEKLLKDTEQTPFLWANDVKLKLNKVSISPEEMSKYSVCLENQTSSSECDSLGVFFELELDIPITAAHRSSTGGIDFHKIEDGNFEVTPYLISVKNSAAFEGIRMFHRLKTPIESRVTSSEEGLKIKKIIHVPYKTKFGSLMLALKISGKESSQIGSFYGVYNFGNLPGERWHAYEQQVDPFRFENGNPTSRSNIKGYREQNEWYKKQFVKLNQNFKKYNPKEDESFEEASGLDVDLERIRFVRVKASGTHSKKDCESVVRRTVIYFGSACLPDPMTGFKYSETPVTIYATNMEIKRDTQNSFALDDQEWPVTITEKQRKHKIHEGKTDHRGCVQFSYDLEHNVYDVQKYFMKKLTFEIRDYSGGVLTEDHYVAFNPWEYGFLTYQNTTQDYKNYKKHFSDYKQCKARNGKSCSKFRDLYKPSEKGLSGILLSENVFPPSVRLNEYRSAIIEPSYAIEPSLDIDVIKNVQVLLSPTIVRKDSLGETIRQTPLVLPVGYWLMRVILAKGPQEIFTGKNWIVSSVVDPLKSFHNWLIGESFFNFNKRYRDAAARWKYKEVFEGDEGHLNEDLIEANNSVLEEMGDIISTHYNEPEELKTYNASDFQNGCKQNSRVPCFSKKEDYISHFDSVVFSENGVISSFVKQAFNVEHFRHLGSKNSIIIELYPTDPDSYEYVSGRNNGNHCILDVENTKFKPYQTCSSSGAENCHDMQIPSHWGLFFTSEAANSNILYPIGKNSYEAFDLPPIGELKVDPKVSQEDLKFDPVHFARNEVSSPESQTTIDKASEDFYNAQVSELVDKSSLHIDAAKAASYCSSVETQYKDLMDGGSIFSENEKELSYQKRRQVSALSLKLCVCGDKTKGEDFQDIENGYQYFIPRIKQCIASKDFANRYQEQVADRIQERIIKNEIKDFCSDFRQTSRYEIQQIQDYTEGFLSYRECVCDGSAEGSLTQKMAECFSKDQGLHLVKDSHQLLELLNANVDKINRQSIPNKKPKRDQDFVMTPYLSNSSEAISSGEAKKAVLQKMQALPELELIQKDDLTHIIQKGFWDDKGWLRRDKKSLSFVHSMCRFWFDDFYNHYVEIEDIENFYKRFVPKMKHLNEISPDNWRVNLEGLDASQSSNAPILKKIKKFYKNSESSYNPFDLRAARLNNSNQMKHPYWKCVSNPIHFFHVERKIMVGDLASNSENTKYKNGRVYTFMTQAARGSDARYEWSRRDALTLSTKASGDVGLNQMRGPGRAGRAGTGAGGVKSWLGGVANWFRGSIGAQAGVGADTSKNQTESDSNRTSRDHTRSVTLAVNHITVDVALEKYRSCMVIRPKARSFEGYSAETLWKDIKSSWFNISPSWFDISSENFSENEIDLARLPYTSLGLMICDDEKTEELPVEEDYYYVHQFFGGHAYEFMSRTIYHNRPYTELLRGREQMDRFMYLLGARGHQIMKNSETGPWNFTKRTNNLFTDAAEIDQNLISAFEDSTLDWSGFYKGIYTHKRFRDHYIYTTEGMKERDQDRQTPSAWEEGTNTYMNWLGDSFSPGYTISHD